MHQSGQLSLSGQSRPSYLPRSFRLDPSFQLGQQRLWFLLAL
jgi:hypothetical protein